MSLSNLGQARSDLQKARGTAIATLTPDDIIIGKDVLELVSTAMYVDPMTVYREYIQNAADAIDEAKRSGLIANDERGTVHIMLDQTTRSVRIRDNGTGIGWSDFARRLAAIGGSGKRGTEARGFRGVGRLAGLGYCQELIFRSRTGGEAQVSELRWDCRKLKLSLREVDSSSSVSDLVQSIVTLQRREVVDEPDRFFEVELKGVVRLRSDRLLTAGSIAEYLSEVAPVPFSPEFSFGQEIIDALSPYVTLGELDIFVSGVEGQIFRPHRDRIQIEDKAPIAFERVEFLTLPSVDGEQAAIVWVLHHDYEGALPVATHVKGLRLRAGNVQVGDNAVLEDLFLESRFNGWAVGEVHVVDRKIVPNGRRDQFDQNAHYNNLLNHLTPLCRQVSTLCRTSSTRRKWLREFDLNDLSAAETIDVLKQGSIGKPERDRLHRAVEHALNQMTKISKMPILGLDFDVSAQGRVAERRNQLDALLQTPSLTNSPLAHMPSEKRELYEDVFQLIYRCSANRIAAKALIDRMLAALAEQPAD